jgi:hypothetical protein
MGELCKIMIFFIREKPFRMKRYHLPLVAKPLFAIGFEPAGKYKEKG